MTESRTDDDEVVLIELGPSAPRLWLAVICTAGLAALLLWIVFAGRPAMGYQVFFLAAAVAFLWLADRLRRTGGDGLVLTNKTLKTKSGRVLSPVDNVRSVERGAFAFKPPNGFLVRLKEPKGQGWTPGLWWQRSRVIGVGGVVSAGQARAMAETLTALTLGIHPDDQAP